MYGLLEAFNDLRSGVILHEIAFLGKKQNKKKQFLKGTQRCAIQ